MYGKGWESMRHREIERKEVRKEGRKEGRKKGMGV